MCRWMAYSGEPIIADDLLFRPEHSIIDQSLHAEMCGFTTNGDGFGIGWYDNDNSTTPGVFKGTHPAWTARTCARSPPKFARHCCSRMCAPRAAHRCSARGHPAATASALLDGCATIARRASR